MSVKLWGGRSVLRPYIVNPIASITKGAYPNRIQHIFYFRTFTTFKKSLSWFLYPKSILIWSKVDWDRGMPHSIRFEMFLLIAVILFWALAFIIRMFF